MLHRARLARRDVLRIALGSAMGAAAPIRLVLARAGGGGRGGCGPRGGVAPRADGPPFTPIAPTVRDELVLAPELEGKWDRIAAMGDAIGADPALGTFGDGCDYLAFVPIDLLKSAPDLAAPHRGFCSRATSSREGLLVVNHEGLEPRTFHADWSDGQTKSEAQLLAEMRAVGMSVLHVYVGTDGRWHRRMQSPWLRRIDATTWCELTGAAAAIDGGPAARGTLANCSGGMTPWGTVLSCEENFHEFTEPALLFHWPDEPYRNRRHYGWVVEIDPFEPRGAPRKHTALGRFRHENVAIRVAPDGAVVAYMGDDLQDACVYKFVCDGKLTGDRGKDRRLLESGRLFAADVKSGRWLLLDYESQPLLRAAERAGRPLFTGQADVLADARAAALVLGATPLERPEDAEIHPKDGSLFVALTNHKRRSPPDHHGRIVRLVEKDGHPAATEFSWSDFAVGGPASVGREGDPRAPRESDGRGRVAGDEDCAVRAPCDGDPDDRTASGADAAGGANGAGAAQPGGFSCPDNLAFDDDGNLWVTTDVASESLGKEPYRERGNNGLFFFRTSGPLAGRAFQAASGPVECELTGPCFTPDGSTLFLSVQHPGLQSPSRAKLTSHWPDGGDALPRSTVVAIRGLRR